MKFETLTAHSKAKTKQVPNAANTTPALNLIAKTQGFIPGIELFFS
jgi:hypothetical protein